MPYGQRTTNDHAHIMKSSIHNDPIYGRNGKLKRGKPFIQPVSEFIRERREYFEAEARRLDNIEKMSRILRLAKLLSND